VLQSAIDLFPGAQQILVERYNATIDVSTAVGLNAANTACRPWRLSSDPVRFCRAAFVSSQLSAWIAGDAANRSAYDMVLGVHRYSGGPIAGIEPGWTTGALSTPGSLPVMTVNDGSASRPRTAAAHEFGHGITLPHAGLTCGSNANGQVGEDWDPDDDGRLQGVAFERTAAGPAERIRRNVDTPAVPWFDLMSYCAGEGNAWLSARNWTRMLIELLKFEALRKAGRHLADAPSTATGAAYVSGLVTADGGVLDAVVPADPSNRPPEADPASPVVVRALGADGSTLADLGAPLTAIGEAAPGTSSFVVALPAGTAAVELRQADVVLDRLARSGAPTVRVTAPARSLLVPERGALTVRWTAADPDGDALRATVEYAANGRSGWRTVFSGPSTGRATVPGGLLAPGTAARVRVTVSDGFSEASARSVAFRTAGPAPAAEIVAPAAGQTQAGGIRTVLVGRAVDGAGARLRGRALTWFAGTRRLGTGERLAVQLPAGRTVLRLRVRDRSGRETSVARTVQVDAPALRLTVLRAPVRVQAGARTLTLRVAASRPSVLRVRGRSIAVGTKVRAVVVTLPAAPRTGFLRLPLTLSDVGRRPAVSQTLTVLRI
jgi:hypothetical protein